MKRPNLIYVFADQLRYDVLGYAGDKKAHTPNLDRLAAQSVNFANAATVSPVCTPHRASLFTGKYTSSTGMVINETCINPNHKTIGYCLHEAGYTMGYLGKWHLVDNHDRSIPQGPARLGFQHASVWKAYNFNHFNYDGYYWDDDGDTEKRVEIDGYQTDAWNTIACDFISNAAGKDDPFALFLSFSPPHDPWTRENLPDGYYEKFKDTGFPHPDNFKETVDTYADRRNTQQEWEKIKPNLEEYRRCYYAMVSHIDDKVGELLDALETTGKADDTIFVFTSDHGEMFGAQGRIYKTTFYDEAVRVPFLVRWPGHAEAGAVRDTCLNTPDIAPTLLGLLGLPVPDEMEGMDLSEQVLTGSGPEPECAFIQGMGHTFQWKDGFEWRAVRTRQYTYARYLCDGSEHLYDNVNDPGQTVNLADETAHAPIKDGLREMMRMNMEDLDDGFHPLSYYKAWMALDDPYTVVRCARGAFEGPYAPVASVRAVQEKLG